MILPLIACEMGLIAAVFGSRTGEIALTCVFIAVFVAVLTVALVGIIRYILTLRKSKELESQISRLEAEKKAIEAELTESRVSMMISQIQPHFIYNTLGTIEQLCLKNPQMASELVRNFSLYLRANFSELDSATPIRF
jgi:sensor histidine kinase YesM